MIYFNTLDGKVIICRAGARYAFKHTTIFKWWQSRYDEPYNQFKLAKRLKRERNIKSLLEYDLNH